MKVFCEASHLAGIGKESREGNEQGEVDEEEKSAEEIIGCDVQGRTRRLIEGRGRALYKGERADPMRGVSGVPDA